MAADLLLCERIDSMVRKSTNTRVWPDLSHRQWSCGWNVRYLTSSVLFALLPEIHDWDYEMRQDDGMDFIYDRSGIRTGGSSEDRSIAFALVA